MKTRDVHLNEVFSAGCSSILILGSMTAPYPLYLFTCKSPLPLDRSLQFSLADKGRLKTINAKPTMPASPNKCLCDRSFGYHVHGSRIFYLQPLHSIRANVREALTAFDLDSRDNVKYFLGYIEYQNFPL